MRSSSRRLAAPWVPPPRCDTRTTMPPPIGAEVGGPGGVSTSYSARLSRTPLWERMANSTYATRMVENRTTYPMSQHNAGEFDTRYLPKPFADPHTKKALLEIGQKMEIPSVKVPVVMLLDLKRDDGSFVGRRHETVFVPTQMMRFELHPQRYAVYATPKNYAALGLPVVDHKIHAEIPKSRKEYEKMRAKQLWDNERWRFSFEFLFRHHEAGPAELLDTEEDWDGQEEVVEVAAERGADAGAARKGPVKLRKARKVKLF
jgi:hypothetical protein